MTHTLAETTSLVQPPADFASRSVWITVMVRRTSGSARRGAVHNGAERVRSNCIRKIKPRRNAFNNNNNHEDIYSAVIMIAVIVRVHSVHLVNVEQHQSAADPQTKPPDLGCEPVSPPVLGSYRLQPPSSFIIFSPKADTHLPSHGG